MKRLMAMVCLMVASHLMAMERITSYTSAILVNPDGSMTVREVISVQAEGNRIKRGIYRDFPTDYVDRSGNRVRVRFDVISVRRNHAPVVWSLKREGNGWRVYMGSMSQTIPPGLYTYELTYQTDRQLGFFSGYDELYWNVTGNGWAFPIDAVRAVVMLPGEGNQRFLEQHAFTGVAGSRDSDAVIAMDSGGQVVFETTRSLSPGEGLTIVSAFTKGLVVEPTREKRIKWMLADNRNLLEGLAGLLLLLAYYLVAWAAVGRDPHSGPIVPLYEPPEGLSPAAVRYIQRMGFDRKA